MRTATYDKLIIHFGCGVSVFLGIAAIIVFLADPFYHYHKPWFHLAAVQDVNQYQVKGALDHFEYDSVLCGSSVVMGMNSRTLDERYDVTTVKAVGNSAGAHVLNYYLKEAFSTHDIKYVFYGMDVFSFYVDPDQKPTENAVDYIVNNNPFDDVEYLWNGSILGIRIPNLIQTTRAGNYDPGLAYQFNQWEQSGAEAVLNNYSPPMQEPSEVKSEEYMIENVEENLDRLELLVQQHPDTQFLFFTPPYSILWWERAYEDGVMNSYLHTLRLCMEQLLPYENVRMYSVSFNEISVITDLSRYTDFAHGNASITEMMAQEIGNVEYEITLDNYEQELDRLLRTVNYFHNKAKQEGVNILYNGPMTE